MAAPPTVGFSISAEVEALALMLSSDIDVQPLKPSDATVIAEAINFNVNVLICSFPIIACAAIGRR